MEEPVDRRRLPPMCSQQDEILGLRADVRVLSARIDALLAGQLASDTQNAAILAILNGMTAASDASRRTSFVAKRG